MVGGVVRTVAGVVGVRRRGGHVEMDLGASHACTCSLVRRCWVQGHGRCAVWLYVLRALLFLQSLLPVHPVHVDAWAKRLLSSPQAPSLSSTVALSESQAHEDPARLCQPGPSWVLASSPGLNLGVQHAAGRAPRSPPPIPGSGPLSPAQFPCGPFRWTQGPTERGDRGTVTVQLPLPTAADS